MVDHMDVRVALISFFSFFSLHTFSGISKLDTG